jgi:hypothetical protein
VLLKEPHATKTGWMESGRTMRTGKGRFEGERRFGNCDAKIGAGLHPALADLRQPWGLSERVGWLVERVVSARRFLQLKNGVRACCRRSLRRGEPQRARGDGGKKREMINHRVPFAVKQSRNRTWERSLKWTWQISRNLRSREICGEACLNSSMSNITFWI